MRFTALFPTLVGVAALLGVCTAEDGASVQMAVTQKLFSYLASVTGPALARSLQHLDLPSVTLDQSSFTITVTSLTCGNGQLGALDLGMSSASTLRFGVQGLTLVCDASWKYREDVWPHIPQGHGTVHVEVGPSTSLAAEASMFVNNAHPQVRMASCATNVQVSSIKFHGGLTGWLLNLFHNTIIKHLQSSLDSAACNAVQKMLENDLNAVMLAYNPLVPLPLPTPFNISQVDFSLTSMPATPSYLAAYLHGEVYNSQAPAEAPFPMPTMPPVPTGVEAHMMELALHPFLFESAAWVYAQADMLRYTVTPAILPPDVPIQLNTETFTDWAPDMEARYPNTPMELGLRVTGAAGVTVDPENINATVPIEIVFRVQTNTSLEDAFALTCPFLGDVSVSTRDALILPVVKYLSCPISLAWSKMGTVHADMAAEFVAAILNSIAIPLINDKLAHGFPLPTLPGVSLVNSQLQQADGFLQFVTDVDIHPEQRFAGPMPRYAPLVQHAAEEVEAELAREHGASLPAQADLLLRRAQREHPQLLATLAKAAARLHPDHLRHVLGSMTHASSLADAAAALAEVLPQEVMQLHAPSLRGRQEE